MRILKINLIVTYCTYLYCIHHDDNPPLQNGYINFDKRRRVSVIHIIHMNGEGLIYG